MQFKLRRTGARNEGDDAESNLRRQLASDRRLESGDNLIHEGRPNPLSAQSR